MGGQFGRAISPVRSRGLGLRRGARHFAGRQPLATNDARRGRLRAHPGSGQGCGFVAGGMGRTKAWAGTHRRYGVEPARSQGIGARLHGIRNPHGVLDPAHGHSQRGRGGPGVGRSQDGQFHVLVGDASRVSAQRARGVIPSLLFLHLRALGWMGLRTRSAGDQGKSNPAVNSFWI